MNSRPPHDLPALEHRKRETRWDAAQRWRVLQETITWADSQATVRRNTPEKCLELQAAKLAAGNC